MIEPKYLYLLVVLSLIIGLVMKNKYVFVITLVIAYAVYYLMSSKEGFEVKSILEYYPLIRDMESRLASSADSNTTEEEEEEGSGELALESSPVKYGDEILLQCLTMDGKYLTGNRDGSNDADPTNNQSEGVFTTNEDHQVHLWKIEPGNDNLSKMNTPVLRGDTIKLMCLNDSSQQSYLIASQTKAPYKDDTSNFKAGVYTKQQSSFPNNYSDHK